LRATYPVHIILLDLVIMIMWRNAWKPE
jgi:hypothetical protein